MKNIGLIYIKQLKDTSRNMIVLIQFIIFPLIGIIMENVMQVPDTPENFFLDIFAVIHISMAPINVMTSVIAEEKEKNTLRLLFFANVKPSEYLLGIGSFVYSGCLVGIIAFAIAGGYTGIELLFYLLIMSVGVIASMLLGSAIGVWSKSQQTATSVMMPVMMVIAFLPMFAQFNDTIDRFARVAYSQQIQLLLGELKAGTTVQPENVIVIAVNIVLAIGVFACVYRKNRLG